MSSVAFTSDHYNTVTKEARTTTCYVATTSLVIVVALIVIFSALLCYFQLDGINMTRDILYPAVYPALFALTIAIPSCIASLRQSKQLLQSHKEMVDSVITLFHAKEIAAMDKQRIKEFIKNDLLDKAWRKEGKTKLLKDVENHYSEKEEAASQNIAAALKESQEEILKSK